MKTKTIYQNQSAIEQQTRQLNQLANKANELLTIINEHDLIKIRSMQDVTDLINGGEAYVKQRIGEQLPENSFSFGIFKLKRNKAVDLLELPDFTKLNELANELKNDVSQLNQLELKGNNVKPTDEAIQTIHNNNSIMAVTANEIDAAIAHEQLAELINTMAKVLPIVSDTKLGDLLLFSHNKEGITTSQRTFYWLVKSQVIINQRENNN